MKQFLALVWGALTQPGDSARMVMTVSAPRNAMWSVLVLISIATVFLRYGAAALGGIPAEATTLGMAPMTFAVVVASWQVIMVFALYFTCQALQGTGSFENTLKLMVWLQMVLLVVEVAQISLLLISPELGQFAAFVSLGLLLWCLVNFLNVLHGYESLGKSTFCLFVAVTGLIVGASLIITLIGAAVPGGYLNV